MSLYPKIFLVECCIRLSVFQSTKFHACIANTLHNFRTYLPDYLRFERC